MQRANTAYGLWQLINFVVVTGKQSKEQASFFLKGFKCFYFLYNFFLLFFSPFLPPSFSLSFETGFHYVAWITSNLKFCFSLSQPLPYPSAGITGMCHPTKLFGLFVCLFKPSYFSLSYTQIETSKGTT
jgi:hypothetical protein